MAQTLRSKRKQKYQIKITLFEIDANWICIIFSRSKFNFKGLIIGVKICPDMKSCILCYILQIDKVLVKLLFISKQWAKTKCVYSHS